MDIFELKAEASKLGYKLIPIKKMPKKLPCVCGCNRRGKWWTAEGLFYECNKCGRKSPVGKTEFDAVNKWNEMIELAKIIEADMDVMYYPQVDGITPTVIKGEAEDGT